jgi:uncharacterized protein (DUF1778 family)
MAQRKMFGFKLGEKERQFLDEAAQSVGQTSSEFARHAVVKAALATLKKMKELNQ